MRPLGLVHLYRIRMRSRFVQEALAATGIGVGVALLFASQIASTSLNGSVTQLTSALVGRSRLQLEARSPLGFEERLVGQVQRSQGVQAAAPVLEQQVNVVGSAGARSVELIGADSRFVDLGGSLLRHFRADALAHQRAVALPLPVAQQIGASSLEYVSVQSGAKTTRVLLGATLQEGDIGALVHSPVLLAPLAYAQQITGMAGRISRIFVLPKPGDERQVRARLLKLASGRLNVEPATYDAKLFGNAAAPTNEATALFALISALVGFLFAFNAMLLTVPSRRAVIADLRIDGYGPRTIAQVLLFDAVVLGAFSSLIGLALGDLLSAQVFNASPGYLSFAFPVGSQRLITWQSIAIAVAGGMLAAGAGVLLPLRDVFAEMSRATVMRARSGRTLSRWMNAAGAVCVVATAAIVIVTPKTAVVGVVLLTMALLLLLPSLIRGVLKLVERATLDLKLKAPFIAVSELRSPLTWSRTVAIAATGAVAVFGSVAIDGTRRDLERGLDASAKGIDSMAEIWVTPTAESDAFATAPFPDRYTAKLASLPGVEAVRPYRGGFLDYDGRRVWVLAPPAAVQRPIAATQFVAGNLATARTRIRGGGWVLLSQALVAEHHLRIGGPVSLPSPDPTTLHLAGVTSNLGWPSGAVILNAEDFARAWGSSDVSAYQITLAPDASMTAGLGEIRRALGSGSGVSAMGASEREARHDAQASQGLSRLTAIRTLVLIASTLAMAAAMASMIWQRRARLGQLKLQGISDLAIWRALLFESALLFGSGCAVGALFGLGGQLLGSHAILATTGFPTIFSPALPLALASFVLASTAAVIIAAVPGFYVARTQPAMVLLE